MGVPPRNVNCLGSIRGRHAKYANAVANFNQALAITPSVPALIDRGIAYRVLGDLDVAVASYTTAISLDPKSTE
jgi:Flp pilus assembly protein TadD